VTAPGRAWPWTGTGSPLRGVVFDLDGTLVDSWDLHRNCLRQAVTATGGSPPGAARLAAAERPTDLGTLRALVGDAHIDAAARAYRSAFTAGLVQSPPAPMPGAAELLAALRARGLAVGVCTGRSRQEAAQMITAVGLPVDLTVAREDCRQPKPAPDGLLTAIRRLGLRVEETLFVGDRPSDAEQGTAAGVHTVLLGPEMNWRGTAPAAARVTRLSELIHTGGTTPS
jgi:HAD superfamily hydrolase (TIGR01509 family)